MLKYEEARSMCSKAPGSKLCSRVVGNEATTWGRMASGSNRPRQVSHVNSLSPSSRSRNKVATSPNLAASPEVCPPNPGAALDRALSSSPLSTSLVTFASHRVRGAVTQLRSPPGHGSGYEKPVTANRVQSSVTWARPTAKAPWQYGEHHAENVRAP